MDPLFSRAAALLGQFKGDTYVHGLHCFDQLGPLAASLGSKVAVIADGVGSTWAAPLHHQVRTALQAAEYVSPAS